MELLLPELENCLLVLLALSGHVGLHLGLHRELGLCEEVGGVALLLILEVFQQVVEYFIVAVQDGGIGEVDCYLFLFCRFDVASICFHCSPQRRPLFLLGLHDL